MRSQPSSATVARSAAVSMPSATTVMPSSRLTVTIEATSLRLTGSESMPCTSPRSSFTNSGSSAAKLVRPA